MEIRTAELSDLDAIARVEAECFPPAEAASEASLAARLAAGKQRNPPTVRGPCLNVRSELANIGGVRRRVARLDFNQMIQPEIVLRALEGRGN